MSPWERKWPSRLKLAALQGQNKGRQNPNGRNQDRVCKNGKVSYYLTIFEGLYTLLLLNESLSQDSYQHWISKCLFQVSDQLSSEERKMLDSPITCTFKNMSAVGTSTFLPKKFYLHMCKSFYKVCLKSKIPIQSRVVNTKQAPDAPN